MGRRIENHAIFAEVAKAYDDCGPLDERFRRGEGDQTLSDDERFSALADVAMENRNLGFRASKAVSPKMAAAIMEKVCPGYNGFEPKYIAMLPADCKVVLAREGSVCIYVQKGKIKLPTRTKLHASEYDTETSDVYGNDELHAGGYNKDHPTPYGGFKGEVRIWWD